MDEEPKTPDENETNPSETDAPNEPMVQPEAPAEAAPETAEPEVTTPPATPTVVSSGSGSAKKKSWLLPLIVVLILVAFGGGWYLANHHNTKASSPPKASITKSSTPASTTSGLQLDPNKDYGNKYADGILPVGDGKYSTTSAKVGTVYACSQYAQNLSSDSGGAQTRGPWFTNNNTEYDLSKKVHVNGSVTWTASFTNTVSGNTRTIVTNDLPTHPTGIFPIAASDPAYAYDRNPNSIKSQNLTFSLPANPSYGSPNCMGGQSGVMLTGVALFNGFDAGGRDAGAWEVQDSCSGHPEKEGEYHYHTLSSCIKDIGASTVVGFALDGFPITGPEVSTNNILTTSDLDECHGITSQITLDGKKVTVYHYVMTQDFPYSVSCFRGTAIQPPGLQPAGGQNQQSRHP